MTQNDKLVKLLKENIIMLESSMAHEIWAKIKTIINKLVQSVPHLFSKTTTV